MSPYHLNFYEHYAIHVGQIGVMGVRGGGEGGGGGRVIQKGRTRIMLCLLNSCVTSAESKRVYSYMLS